MADRVALAWAGFAGRAALTADKVVALRVDEDIAARLRGELRPAAREGPIGWRGRRIFCDRGARDGPLTTRGLCHARREEESEENNGNC